MVCVFFSMTSFLLFFFVMSKKMNYLNLKVLYVNRFLHMSSCCDLPRTNIYITLELHFKWLVLGATLNVTYFFSSDQVCICKQYVSLFKDISGIHTTWKTTCFLVNLCVYVCKYVNVLNLSKFTWNISISK